MLQSLGLQRVGPNLVTEQQQQSKQSINISLSLSLSLSLFFLYIPVSVPESLFMSSHSSTEIQFSFQGPAPHRP